MLDNEIMNTLSHIWMIEQATRPMTRDWSLISGRGGSKTEEVGLQVKFTTEGGGGGG